MRPKTLYAAVAGVFLVGSAAISSAAQELVCDRQPTSNSAASCAYREVSSSSGSSSFYVLEPAASGRVVVTEPVATERVIVTEPVRERVVVREPAGTPVDTIVMRYPVDDAFPDPSPQTEAQSRVFVPREPQRIVTPGWRNQITPD